ncbi:hypothetical protein C8D70_10989 [Chryseobacterium sp. CBTAP 102]|nr:hypothetical protein C8D70_10989 [Chryseobacterium sp. CBTAP 102]SIQ43103.1 hypothetical protein SAMN05880573_105137 [Chryseobacterium sp. RU33C]
MNWNSGFEVQDIGLRDARFGVLGYEGHGWLQEERHYGK